jgi:hypothetical protein
VSPGVEAGPESSPPSSPKEKRSFTSWKLDLLTAINLDAAVRAVDMRFVVYLLQGLNETSRAFNVSDETAAEELNCNRDRLKTGRKRLEDAGWLIVRRGRGFADGSWYRFDDSRVEHHLQERDDRRAIRRDTRADRRASKAEQAMRCAEKTRRSAGEIKPRPVQRCAEKTRHNVISEEAPTDESCAEKTRRKTQSCAEKTRHSCAEKTRHVHLRDTPITIPLPAEDMATEPHRSEAFDRSAWDHEDWQALYEERAGILEFDDSYSRAEAEQLAAAEISKLRAIA